MTSIKPLALNKLEMIGGIDANTPICVITEIARSHGIIVDNSRVANFGYLEEMVRQIKITRVSSIVEKAEKDENGLKVKREDLSLIARFVNSLAPKWDLNTLMQAFEHLKIYMKRHEAPLPSGEWVVGEKTNLVPLAYDACLLYKLCKYHGIRTQRNTTLDQLGHVIRYYTQDVDKMRETLLESLQHYSRNTLANMLVIADVHYKQSPIIRVPSFVQIPEQSRKEKEDINPNTIRFDELKKAYATITSPEKMLSRINPVSHEEAIMMAAVVYGIDTTESHNPHREYTTMRYGSPGGTSQRSGYLPVDPEFKRRYLKNASWYNVSKTWSPKIPSIYNNEALMRFAIAEGYTPLEIRNDSAENLLNLSRVVPTFYLGNHPNSLNLKTPIELEDIDNIDHNLLISHGAVEGERMIVYTITELIETFKSSLAFTNPLQIKEQFTTTSIRKLKIIAQEKVKSDIIAVAIEYQRLLDVINMVERYAQASSEQAKELAGMYVESDEKVQEQIRETFQQLLDMSMMMRGWKVSSQELPIELNKTQFLPDRQDEVEKNSLEGISGFEIKLSRLPEIIAEKIKKLPLMITQTRDGSVMFRPSNSDEQGRTISARLNIVKEGVTTYSCIRLSSSYFASSAYYYMAALKLPIPFQVEKLANIS